MAILLKPGIEHCSHLKVVMRPCQSSSKPLLPAKVHGIRYLQDTYDIILSDHLCIHDWHIRRKAVGPTALPLIVHLRSELTKGVYIREDLLVELIECA